MMAPSGNRREATDALAQAALALCLLVPIAWGASPHAPWDVDNLAPGPALRALSQHFAPGWYASYGPLPYLILAAIYLPLLALFKLTGELGSPSAVYPWGFEHARVAILTLTVAARLVSWTCAILIARLAARRDLAQVSPAPGWTVALLLLGSPAFAYYAHTSNVDLQYLFWLWVAFHLIETPSASARRLAAGAACAALAMCSKEQSAPFALVACGAAMVRAARTERGDAARLRAALQVLAVPLVMYAIVWQLPFNLSGWQAHHRFLFEQARYPRTYPFTLVGTTALARQVLHFLPVAFGPLLLAAVSAALLLRSSWRGLGLRALGSALYLATFVVSIGYVYPRFLLPLLLVLLPLGARGVREVMMLVRDRPAGRNAVATVCATLALAGAPALSLAMLGDPRLAMERWLRSDVPVTSSIEIAGSPAFQARVPLERRVIHTRVESLLISPRGPRGDVVLLSGLDLYAFQRDARVRAVWWDSLEALGSSGRYRELVFRPPAAARFSFGLPVAPTVIAWVRLPPAAP